MAKRTINPTIKQKKAFDILVESGRKGKSMTKGEAMVQAGYTIETAKAPTKLTESEGWKKLLEECGLTEELIATALTADIKKKKGKRVMELNLGAEILGMKKRKEDEKPPTELHLHLHNTKITKVISQAEADIKKALEGEIISEQ